MAGILKVDTIQNANADNIITQTNSTTLTIGASGDTVTLAAGATSSGFGRSGTVNWDTTKKTSGFTAVNGVGYFCDTTSSSFTVTLPASPSAGDIVAFSDYTGTWGTNNITVGRNSSNINGAAADLILNGNNTTATLIYVDATEGWRVIDTGSLSEVNIAEYIAATGGTESTCGDYKIHSFTGPGTFTVTNAGNPLGSSTVDYLVVAGGGGGGFGNGGGGGAGGAGGYRESSGNSGPYTASPLATPVGITVTTTAYPITVGGGGPAGPSPNVSGTSGSNSVFSTITSAGGGGGGGTSNFGSPQPGNPASNGGSGGGGAWAYSTFGSGNTPPTSPPQGNNGGTGNTPPSGQPFNSGGGGGGAITAGTNGINNFGGAGGNGTPSSITGSPVVRAGGGGGGQNACGTIGSGGPGGGGNGGRNAPRICGQAGTVNTGGGGGGGSQAVGGAGGSGVVVIRYKFQ